MCPECGGDLIRVVEFDFGICSQTGYHDCGERFQCRECGASGSMDDLSIDRNVMRLKNGAEFGDALDTTPAAVGLPREFVRAIALT